MINIDNNTIQSKDNDKVDDVALGYAMDKIVIKDKTDNSNVKEILNRRG